MSAAKQILVVDDDLAMNSLLRDFLQRQGYSVSTSTSASSALAWLNAQSKEPDLVLSDINLGTVSGLSLAKTLTQERPSLPVILFSVLEDMEEDAMKSGARLFLRKPFSLAKLAKILEKTFGLLP